MKPAVVALLVLLASDSADAQPASDPGASALVSTDPIRCWWQSDTGAVTIGQSFSVTLTCAVIDTADVQVVPDESRLGVATVQVAPFEILGGSHPADARRGARRVFQYHYTLRVIDPDVIGRDLNIPSLPIQYRVRSRVGGASTLEGRDLTYVMPAIPIKVLSVVPADAADIRDGSRVGLGEVDSLRFRAGLFRIAGVASGVIALMAALWAFAPWTRAARTLPAESRHHIPDRVVIGELSSRLDGVKAETARGWSDDLVARALVLLRVVSALAIGRPINQRLANPKEAAGARLAVSYGWLRPTRATVASSVTADDVTRAIAELPEDRATRKAHLEPLREALAVLTDAAYRSSGDVNPTALDEALDAGVVATRRLAAERTLIKERLAAIQPLFRGRMRTS